VKGVKPSAVLQSIGNKAAPEEQVTDDVSAETTSKNPATRRAKVAKAAQKQSRATRAAAGKTTDDPDVENADPKAVMKESVEQKNEEDEVDLKSKPTWDDLDADDINDPFMVSEYVVEIFEYMKELEVQLHTLLIFFFFCIHHTFKFNSINLI
jgi:G2/mitotic-specific cyclin 2